MFGLHVLVDRAVIQFSVDSIAIILVLGGPIAIFQLLLTTIAILAVVIVTGWALRWLIVRQRGPFELFSCLFVFLAHFKSPSIKFLQRFQFNNSQKWHVNRKFRCTIINANIYISSPKFWSNNKMISKKRGFGVLGFWGFGCGKIFIKKR